MFKFKLIFLYNTINAGIINAKIAVSLKYFSDFWRILEMPLIIYEINLILTWSENCVVFEGDRETTFVIIYTKLYVPVVTLWIQDKIKLL